MLVDLATAAIVVLFGLSGMNAGLVAQMVHWSGMTAGYFAARPSSRLLAPPIARRFALSPTRAKFGIYVLAFFAAAQLAAWGVRGSLTRIFRGAGGARWNQAGGFLVGAGEGALLAFALLSGLVLFEKPIVRYYYHGKEPALVANSRALALARAHNFFDLPKIPELPKAKKYLEALRDASSSRNATTEARELRKFLDNPEVKALLSDPRIAGQIPK